MFGANNVSNVVQNAIRSSNSVDLQEANDGKVSLISNLVGILMVLVINLMVGPWLWNNVLKRLVPVVGKAQWYDTVLLGVLIGLVVPN